MPKLYGFGMGITLELTFNATSRRALRAWALMKKRNPQMSRNFGLGTRHLASAGRLALAAVQRAGGMSYSSVDTHADRWSLFAAWSKENGVGRMEGITPEMVARYGRELADAVRDGDMAVSTAQNRISSINTVMHSVTTWHSVRPVHDCHIPERDSVRHDAPPGHDQAHQATAALWNAGQDRCGAVADLCHSLGLRSKEASLLDCSKALEEAEERGMVTISEGTKGGLEREVPITLEAFAALQAAAEVQGEGRNLMPEGTSWAEWRDGELREGRELLQEHGVDGFHELRAAWACERYEELVGHPAPCAGGEIEDREADEAAREEIAAELGHGRTDVCAAYIGGRR